MVSVAIAVSRPGPAEVLIGVSGVVDRDSVDEIARLLAGAGGSDDRVVVVDLARAPEYDYRVLKVLDDARRALVARGAVLHVRGLSARSLTGLAEAGLPDALQAYRASLGVAEPTGPWEPGTACAVAVRSPDELELVVACVELAAGPDPREGGREGALGVTDQLVQRCRQHLGASAAAVVLRDPSSRPWVASSSAERAGLVEAGGAAGDEGPAVECLDRGEPVAAPDLGDGRSGDRWPVYAGLAARHGFAAARALPIRPPAAERGTGQRTVGALVLLADAAGPMAATDLGVAQSLADLAAIAVAAAGRHTAGCGPVG